MKTSSSVGKPAWARSFSAALQANPLTASTSETRSEMCRRNDLVQSICCLNAGPSSRSMQGTREEVLSFTMLTINADDHGLFKNFHRPEDEKRMVVILLEDQYDE